MMKTELKMDELEQVAGGSVLEFFYQDLGFSKVALEWYLYWNTPKKGSSDGEGGIIHF